MCNRRLALAAVVTCALASSTPLDAQSDVAYLRRQYETLTARRAVLGQTLDSIRRLGRTLHDDSLTAGGRTVLFVRAQLSDGDRATLVAALEADAAFRRATFGASAHLVTDDGRWLLESARYRFGRRLRIDLNVDDGRRIYAFLDVPLDSTVIATFARTRASAALRELHPWFASYVKGDITLDTLSAAFARAANDLALAGSTVGRRCRGGSLDDCRVLLDQSRTDPTLTRLFTPDDYRDLARRRPKPRHVAQSEWATLKEQCSDELSDAACARIVQVAPPPFPFRDEVRSSFAVYATMRGAEDGLDRLRDVSSQVADDPIAFFAYVAGMPSDSLIAAWRARVDDAGSVEARVSLLPVLLSSIGWGGVLLVVAMARRPR